MESSAETIEDVRASPLPDETTSNGGAKSGDRAKSLPSASTDTSEEYKATRKSGAASSRKLITY